MTTVSMQLPPPVAAKPKLSRPCVAPPPPPTLDKVATHDMNASVTSDGYGSMLSSSADDEYEDTASIDRSLTIVEDDIDALFMHAHNVFGNKKKVTEINIPCNKAETQVCAQYYDIDNDNELCNAPGTEEQLDGVEPFRSYVKMYDLGCLQKLYAKHPYLLTASAAAQQHWRMSTLSLDDLASSCGYETNTSSTYATPPVDVRHEYDVYEHVYEQVDYGQMTLGRCASLTRLHAPATPSRPPPQPSIHRSAVDMRPRRRDDKPMSLLRRFLNTLRKQAPSTKHDKTKFEPPAMCTTLPARARPSTHVVLAPKRSASVNGNKQHSIDNVQQFLARRSQEIRRHNMMMCYRHGSMLPHTFTHTPSMPI